MNADVIKSFVEEHKAKGHLIMLRCDNEHFYYDNADGAYNAPIIWDWTNECFTVLTLNTENVMNQSNSPMCVTKLDLGQIQDIEAFISSGDAVEFIQKNYTDAKEKECALKLVGRIGSLTMRPDSSKWNNPARDLMNKGNIRTVYDTKGTADTSDDDPSVEDLS